MGNTIIWFYTDSSHTNGHAANNAIYYNGNTNKVTIADAQNAQIYLLNENDIVDYYSLP